MTPLSGSPTASRRRAERRARSAGQEASRREPSTSRPGEHEPVKTGVVCSQAVWGDNSGGAPSRADFLKHGVIPSAEVRNVRTGVRAGQGLLSPHGPREGRDRRCRKLRGARSGAQTSDSRRPSVGVVEITGWVGDRILPRLRGCDVRWTRRSRDNRQVSTSPLMGTRANLSARTRGHRIRPCASPPAREVAPRSRHLGTARTPRRRRRFAGREQLQLRIAPRHRCRSY